jgi:hypothetical protein
MVVYHFQYQLIGLITAPPPVATTNRCIDDKSIRTSLLTCQKKQQKISEKILITYQVQGISIRDFLADSNVLRIY